MKFKKLLVLTLVAAMAFFGTNAMAAQGDPGWYEQKNNPSVVHYFSNPYNGKGFVWMADQTPEPPVGPQANVTSIAEGQALSDTASSSTSWFGYGDDYGEASGNAYVYGYNESTASADGTHGELQWDPKGGRRGRGGFAYVQVPNEATAGSYLDANAPEIKSWSWAVDFILASSAGAGAEIEGDRHDIKVGGWGLGLNGQPETSYTEVGIGGYIQQSNSANEIGGFLGSYGDTFATAGNFSELQFNAFASDLDNGQSCKFLFWEIPGAQNHLHGIEGNAIVKGESFVAVDPFGSNRSSYATTENSAKINFAHLETGFVGGNGGVAGAAVNGGVFGYGNADFSYTGLTAGSGSAMTQSNIQTSGNTSNVSVFSTSSAVAE